MGDVWPDRFVSRFRGNCVIQAKLPGCSRLSRVARDGRRSMKKQASSPARGTDSAAA